VSGHELFLRGGRVRPIWRFFLSASVIVGAGFALQLVLGFLLGLVGKPSGLYLANALFAVVMLPALLGIFKVFMSVFEEKPLGAVGLAFCGRWRAELALGLAVGAAMILAVAAIEWVLGLTRFSWSDAPGRALTAWALGLFVVLAIAATNEELAFRGYPFQRLVDSIGPVGAIAVLSALFGVMHLGNPHRTWVSTANTALVGIPFSIAYLRTRMLWLPIGMHFSWNFVLGFVVGLPVSGLQVPVSIVKGEAVRGELLTGGSYGPEGGLFATGVIVLATGYLAFSKSIYISEETKTLISTPVMPDVTPVVLRLNEAESHAGPDLPGKG
jgi:hypothetical protein